MNTSTQTVTLSGLTKNRAEFLTELMQRRRQRMLRVQTISEGDQFRPVIFRTPAVPPREFSALND